MYISLIFFLVSGLFLIIFPDAILIYIFFLGFTMFVSLIELVLIKYPKKHTKKRIWVPTCLLFISCILFILYVTGYNRNTLRPRVEFRKSTAIESVWLTYDNISSKLSSNKSHSILFQVDSTFNYQTHSTNSYQIDGIVNFAKLHGWSFRGKAEFKKEDIINWLNGNKNIPSETVSHAIEVIFTGYGSSPIWIKDTCTALAFDTGHYAGTPSFVIVRYDSKEMLVRDNSKVFAPDKSDTLMLPNIFKNEKYPQETVTYY